MNTDSRGLKRSKFGVLLVPVIVILCACGPNPIASTTSTASVDATATFEAAVNQALISTAAFGTAVQQSVDATAAAQAVPPSYAESPGLEPLTVENVSRMVEIGRIGRGTVYDFAWHPGGSEIAVGTSIGVWIYAIDADSEPPLFIESAQPVSAIAYSPNGAHLAVSSYEDEMVRVWDVANGRELMVLIGRNPAWSPDGFRLATTSTEDGTRVWDAANGRELMVLIGDDATWSPDGSRLATDSVDGTRVWDATNGRELMVLIGNDAAWSPDGSRLATGSADGTTHVWNAANGRELMVLIGNDPAWSPDGSRLATGSAGGTTHVWNAATGDELAVLTGGPSIRPDLKLGWSVAWSPDGSRLAIGSEDGTRIWDVATGRESSLLRANTFGGTVVWSPDGASLASDSGPDFGVRESLQIWDVASSSELATLAGHSDCIESVQWSSDGMRLVTQSSYSRRTWDAASGDELIVQWGGHRLSPDGARIATVDQETVRIRDTASGHELAVLNFQDGSTVAWSPDGMRVIVGEHGGRATMFDAVSGRELEMLGDSVSVRDIAWSPDGARMSLVPSFSDPMRILDVASGRELMVLNDAKDVYAVDFATWLPDGSRLATSSHRWNGLIQIWDTVTGQVLAEFGEFGEGIYSLGWSPDGTLVVTRTSSGFTRIRDAASGRELAALSVQGVVSVAWSPDGTRLALGFCSGTVQVWGVVSD